jgi:hypothetical protein
MAINWGGLQTQLIAIHNSDNEYNTSQIAQAIEDAYVVAIQTATESTALNVVATYTVGGLKAGIESAMTTAVGTFNQSFDITLVDSGLIAFWMGATFTPTNPAAGQATVASISVLNGGAGTPQTPPIASNSNIAWVNMWISYFQSHANTVSGTLIGATSVPAPLVVSFSGIL